MPDDLRQPAAEWAEWTATEKGLPPRVTDIVILCHVARLLGYPIRIPFARSSR
jgi:hypothetical protein